MQNFYKIFLLFMLSFFNIFCEFPRTLIFPGNTNSKLPEFAGKHLKIPHDNGFAHGYLHNSEQKKLMVFFHGNGTSMYEESIIVPPFISKGYSCLLIEYPGYGLAKKYKSSEKNIYFDSYKLINEVQTSLNIPAKNTFILGRSIGSGPGIEMIKRNLASKIILVSPFTSIKDVAEHLFIPILPSIFIRDYFENKNKAKSIKTPVLIIHGKNDKLIPFWMGESLNESFANSKLLTLEGFGHNDIFLAFDKKLYQEIFEFLKD